MRTTGLKRPHRHQERRKQVPPRERETRRCNPIDRCDRADEERARRERRRSRSSCRPRPRARARRRATAFGSACSWRRVAPAFRRRSAKSTGSAGASDGSSASAEDPARHQQAGDATTAASAVRAARSTRSRARRRIRPKPIGGDRPAETARAGVQRRSPQNAGISWLYGRAKIAIMTNVSTIQRRIAWLARKARLRASPSSIGSRRAIARRRRPHHRDRHDDREREHGVDVERAGDADPHDQQPAIAGPMTAGALNATELRPIAFPT